MIGETASISVTLDISYKRQLPAVGQTLCTIKNKVFVL